VTAWHPSGMIPEEEPVVVEEVDPFEDVEADFADLGPVGTYMLSTRRPGVVGEEATE
jgi:hypothetical protein